MKYILLLSIPILQMLSGCDNMPPLEQKVPDNAIEVNASKNAGLCQASGRFSTMDNCNLKLYFMPDGTVRWKR